MVKDVEDAERLSRNPTPGSMSAFATAEKKSILEASRLSQANFLAAEEIERKTEEPTTLEAEPGWS